MRTTAPSGKLARISSSPPIASMTRASVPTYISARLSILEILACLTPSSSARCAWVSARASRKACKGISAIIWRAFASLRSRIAGSILACSSLKFRAMLFVLLFQFVQVLVIETIGNRYVDFVPPVIAGLIPADQQQSIAFRIEGVEYAVGSAFVLNPQFPHMGVTAAQIGRAHV